MNRTSFTEKALAPHIAGRTLGSALRTLRGAAQKPSTRDGDGDGKINDNTPLEAPAPTVVEEAVNAVKKVTDRKRVGAEHSFARTYSFERMLKNLDLDAIDTDHDKELTLSELHKLVGFPEPDANSRRYIIDTLKQVGTKRGGRGRPAATYRTGDFIDLLKEVRKPRRPIKVRRPAKHEMTIEEINASLGEHAMDPANLHKILKKMGVKPIRTHNNGKKGRPFSVYKSRDAYKAITRYFDEYGWGTGPYGPRHPLGRTGQSEIYQKSLQAEMSEKILGRRLGERGRARRAARRMLPKDGDGDGFYSPAPGMPDKTPIPTSAVDEIVELTEQDWETIDINAPEVSAARAAAKRMKEAVEKKHGEIRTVKQAKTALKKVFPNAKIRGLYPSGSDDTELSPSQRAFTIGLLHAGSTKPRTAKRLKVIEGRRNTNRGSSAGTFFFGATPTGWARVEKFDISLNIETYNSVMRDGIGQPHSQSPWSYTVARGMQDQGVPREEIAEFLAYNVAMHEFGHAMHYDYALRSWGSADGDEMPSAATWEMYNIIDPTGNLYAQLAQHHEQQERNRELILNNPASSGAAVAALRAQTENDRRNQSAYTFLNQLYRSGHFGSMTTDEIGELAGNALSDAVTWDGTPKDKRARIIEELSKVSGYASKRFPGQYREGVAETIARREGSAGVTHELPSDMERHIRDILIKQEIVAMKAAKKEEFLNISIPGCAGLFKFDENGKLAPLDDADFPQLPKYKAPSKNSKKS